MWPDCAAGGCLPKDPRLFDRVFGTDRVAGSAHDLFALMDATPAEELPPL